MPRLLPLSGYVVVVDPGHNGANGMHPRETGALVDAGGFQKACNTTGTAGDDGWPEAAFTWEMAQALRSGLMAAGAEVVLTRNDNEGWGPCIDQRGLISGRADADLLLSIHADGAPSSGHGFHVIHPTVGPNTTDAKARDSAHLAQLVRDSLVVAGRSPSSYLGQEGLDGRKDLGTLNRSVVPSVMIELGNMRNASDLIELHDEGWQDSTAAAIVAAVGSFASGANVGVEAGLS